MAAVDADAATECRIADGGKCAFTASREGTYRIDLTLPSAASIQMATALTVSGFACQPMLRPTDKAASCHVYLSGGSSHTITGPVGGHLHIVRAEPDAGQPVTIIP